MLDAQLACTPLNTGVVCVGDLAAQWTRGGLLMSYYADPQDQAYSAASSLENLARREAQRSAIEQATKFQLIINLNTTKQLRVSRHCSRRLTR